MKRAIDVLVSLVGLVISAPVIAISALAVWLQDRRNPVYVSLRVRNPHATFRMYKFRSMVPNADRIGGTSTSADDRRLTPAGRVMRLFKIDELPQLWNVLIGDMSLVGPRPQVVQDAIKYTAEENQLFRVRPGITDFASIVFADEANILAGATDADARYDQLIRPWKSRLGLFYVRNHSILVDLQVVFLTIVTILSRQTALKRLHALLSDLGAEAELLLVARRELPLVPARPPGTSTAAENGPYLPESVFVRAAWLQTLNRIRRVPVALIQMGLMAASNYLAWMLRYDGLLTPDRLSVMWPALAWLVGIRTLIFIPLRLFQGLWLYTGIYDLQSLFAGVAVSTIAFWVWIKVDLPPATYPYSVVIIDAMALFLLLGGIRMSRRLFAEFAHLRHDGSTVLVYGAGRAGEMAIREMRHSQQAKFRPVGFVDDNMRKLGLRIHGVPVLGTRRDLSAILSDLRPDELLLSTASMSASDHEQLRTLAASYGVKVRTGPERPEVVGDHTIKETHVHNHSEKCPKCGVATTQRSKTRNLIEQLRRSMSQRRLYKCSRCGWRGWLIPTTMIGSLERLETVSMDLHAIDRRVPPLMHPRPEIVVDDLDRPSPTMEPPRRADS